MPSIPSCQKTIPSSVALLPGTRDWAIARATQAGFSFSAYIATLVDGDRRLNLLPEILQSRLEEPAKKGGRP